MVAASPRKSRREPFRLGGEEVAAGERRTIELPLARLATHTDVSLPVHVVHGRKPGPCLFVSGAIHGDEVNGVEIVHRLLKSRTLGRLRGTLLAVPVVNVFGFLANSRYLPDRRDLNRSFPGSERGSLAARLAHLFMSEIVGHATHGVDLHTAGRHRANLPQIRASLDDEETARIAHAFGAPVVLDARVRDGSLREAVREQGAPMLLYEAGEALRFDELSIRTGVRGVIRVMRAIEMLPRVKRSARSDPPEPVVCGASSWIRAPEGGVLRSRAVLGQLVRVGESLGTVSDPFGDRDDEVRSHVEGIVIGRHLLPVVNEGDALFHVARTEGSDAEAIDLVELQANLLDQAQPQASEDPLASPADDDVPD